MQALSADAEWLRAARRGGLQGRVHSVFERVINVQQAHGPLFTIAAAQSDDAPATVVTDARRLGPWGVAPGEPVCVQGDTLQVGNCARIALAGARPWEPRLPAYPDDDSRLRRNLQALRATPGIPALGAGTSPRELATALAQHATSLRRALARGAFDDAQRHGTALLGLGAGLTPSGDDYLVGLFAALQMTRSPCADMAPVCGMIAARAAERTHAISVAALRAAARGRVRERLCALMRAVAEGTPAAVAAAWPPVLAIGSSSGADMLAGLMDGFELAAARRGAAACTAGV